MVMVNKNIAQLMAKSMMQGSFKEEEAKRNFLTRTFDLLNVGGYVTAGIAKGMLSGSDISIAEGISGGLKAGNPFGKGYAKGKHTYSEVLDVAGWKPTTLSGKIARGVVGFAGDVLLDPTTYLTGGFSALVKGTGKKAAAKVGGTLSYKAAKDIVEASSKASGTFLTNKDLLSEIMKLRREFNKLAGINTTAKDLRWSLGGTMFGEKIFGRYANVGMTLAKADTLQKIGDATLAPLYANARHAILGGKLGKLFKTKSTLYNLSKTNPAAVYELMKAGSEAKRIGYSMKEMQKLIKEKAKKFEGLTEYEIKEIITLMEDASKWSRVEKAVKFNDVVEANSYRKQMEAVQMFLDSRVKSLVKAKNDAFIMLNEVSGNLAEKRKILSGINDAYLEKLTNLKTQHVTDSDKLYELNRFYEDEIAKLDEELAKVKITPEETIEVSKFKEIEKADKEVRKSVIESIEKYWEEVSGSVEQSKDIKEIKAQKYIASSQIIKPDDISQTHYTRLMNELKRNYSITRKSKKGAEKIRSAFPQWNEVYEGGVYTFTPDAFEGLAKDVTISNKNIIIIPKPEKMSEEFYTHIVNELATPHGLIEATDPDDIFNISKFFPKWKSKELGDTIVFYPTGLKEGTNVIAKDVNALEKIKPNREKLIADISNYIYGSPNKISPFTEYKELKPIIQMIRGSANKANILEYAKKHADTLSGKSSFIEEWIGNRIGFGKGQKFKNWDEFYTNRINEFTKVEKTSDRVIKDFIDLKKVELEYKHYLSKFDTAETIDDVKEIMRQFEEKDLMKMIDDSIEEGVSKRRLKFIDDDVARRKPKKAGYLDIKERFDVQQEFVFKVVDGDTKITNVDRKHLHLTDFLTDRFEELLRFEKKTFDNLSDKQKNYYYNEIVNCYRQWGMDDKQWRKLYMSESQLAMKQKLIEEVIKRKEARRVKYFSDKIIKGSKVHFEKDGKIITGVVEGINETGDGTKFLRVVKRDDIFPNVNIKDVKAVRLGEELLTLENLTTMSETTSKQISRKIELLDLLNKNKVEIAKLESEGAKELEVSINKISEEFSKSTKVLFEDVSKLENIKANLEKSMLKGPFSETNIKKLNIQAKEIENALVNEDAFEQYVRVHYTGDEGMEKILRDNVTYTGEIILKPGVNVSDKVRDVASFLKQELLKIGESEVGIGKLKADQFENAMLDYLPHILTDEGKKVFAVADEVYSHLPRTNFGFGYGGEFNPYAKTRRIKRIPDGVGGFIENPNILQLEEWMQREYGHILKGKSAFQTNIADIYLTRALKNTKLLYDNEYMNNMLNVFGKNYEGVVEEGYGIVMNYGKLKETAVTTSRINMMCDISLDLSNYMRATFKDIQNFAYKELSKFPDKTFEELLNEKVIEHIREFLKENYSETVRKEIFESHLLNFKDSTKLGGILEDLGTPMAELTQENAREVHLAFNHAKDRFTEIVRNNILSFEKKKMYEEANEIRETLPVYVKLSEMVDSMMSPVVKKVFGLNEGEFLDYAIGLRKKAHKFDKTRVERIISKAEYLNSLEPVQIKQVNRAIMEKANRSRMLQIAKDQSRFLQVYDKMLYAVKVLQTSIMPNFHVRNKVSNIFNSMLGIGEDALNKDFHMKTFEAIKNKGDIDGVLKVVKSNGDVSHVAWKDLFDEAIRHNVLDEGFFTAEMANIKDMGVLRRVLNIPKHLDPTDMNNFVWYKKGAEVGSFIEGQDRFIHFASQVSRGMSFEEAAESVQKFLFDYSDLTAFEQHVMKRIIPYYTWMRKNIPLQLEMMMEKPNAYQNIGKVFYGIENMVDEEDRVNQAYLEEYVDDWIQMPWKGSRDRVVMFNPAVAFVDVNKIPVTGAKDAIQNLSPSLSPFIKIPIEQIINKNIYFDSSIVRPGQSHIGRRLDHIASHIAPYQALKGFISRKGDDFDYHALGTLTGIKFLNYDYEKFKQKKIEELLRKKSNL